MKIEEKVARAITLAQVQRIHTLCTPFWFAERQKMVDAGWEENADLAADAIAAVRQHDSQQGSTNALNNVESRKND